MNLTLLLQEKHFKSVSPAKDRPYSGPVTGALGGTSFRRALVDLWLATVCHLRKADSLPSDISSISFLERGREQIKLFFLTPSWLLLANSHLLFQTGITSR